MACEYISLAPTGESSCSSPVNIVSEVFALRQETVDNRRWFHANPELSFEEFKTSAKVAEILKGYGIEEVFEGVAKTGVVAIIRGRKPGKCIGLRADMDALPLPETADISYRSQNDGVMHACGHDGHMSGLLAAAKVLFQERERLSGVVKCIFQPAEEGYGGAKVMIEEGVLTDGPFGPKVDEIYGIHLWSFQALGKVCCQEGPVMAASDRFCIDVKGKGGHGAVPHQSVDAIVEAAHLVTSLQTIISRNIDPLQSGVLTCGTIHGGFGYNIIADKVTIDGTCRTFTKENQEMIKRRMGEVCCGVATCFGGDISLEYKYGYPPTVNSYPECVAKVNAASAAIVGEERSGQYSVTMGAEDFSYFLQEIPGCFFFVGAALPGDIRPHHKSVFDFDEDSILVSASIYVQLIRNLLIE